MKYPIPEGLKIECPNCHGIGSTKRTAFASAGEMDAGGEPRLIDQRCSACRSKGWIWALDQDEMAERIVLLEFEKNGLAKLLDDALAANERDRTQLHRVVRAIDDEITGRMWLLEGRGSYEWDDDKYRQEFGWAVKALQAKLEPLRKIASDLANSPTTQAKVDEARASIAQAKEPQ